MKTKESQISLLQEEQSDQGLLFTFVGKLFFDTGKPVLSDHSKRRPKIGFQDWLSLNAGQKYCRMLQESILQYFWPSLSYHLSLRPLFCLLLSGRLRQVLLYFGIIIWVIQFWNFSIKEFKSSDIWATTFDFQQCGMLTSVDLDQPVQPSFTLRNSKWCSVSSLTVIKIFKPQTKALIRLRIYAGWTEALLVAHTTLLEIHVAAHFYFCFSSKQTCDCCNGTRFGPGLRIIRPVTHLFGIRNLPFLFSACSSQCLRNFRNSKETLSEILYGRETVEFSWYPR